MKTRNFLAMLATLAALAVFCPANDIAASLLLLPFGVVPLLDEERLTIPQAARKLGVNPSTVWRWCLKGVRNTQLSSFSIGAKRYVTSQSLENFVAATTAAAAGERPIASGTTHQREVAISRAEAELAADGI